MRSIGVLVNERRLKAAYGHFLPQGEKEEKHAVWRDRWSSGSGGLSARHSTFLIQLCGSTARPYWISISCLRSPIATGPAAPPLMTKSPLAEHTLPIGEITAAVPQAKASFSLPLAASLRHCWMV